VSDAVEDLSKLPDIPESRRGTRRTHVAEVETVEKQLKRARVRQFEFYCDEPPMLGGEDQYPQPLAYLAAAVGF
jgi:hypothetical protein